MRSGSFEGLELLGCLEDRMEEFLEFGCGLGKALLVEVFLDLRFDGFRLGLGRESLKS
jgi:hypothetical protein